MHKIAIAILCMRSPTAQVLSHASLLKPNIMEKKGNLSVVLRAAGDLQMVS